MSTTEETIVRFGEFELDKARRLLRSGNGQNVPLTPRVFETLLYLVEHQGDLVDKRDLLDAVWPDVVVEENNLTQAISTLRRALGERPRQHRYIATVPGRGYRFVADVVAARAGDTGPPTTGSSESPRAGRIAALVAIVAGSLVALFAVQQSLNSGGAPVADNGVQLTGQMLVSQGPSNHRQPTFSADGSMVAFVSSDEAGVDQIHVQNIAAGKPQQITFLEERGAANPSWSPNNDRIVFHRTEGGGIWSVGPLGDPPPQLLIAAGRVRQYSFDGGMIIYQSGDEIRLADSDGTQQSAVPGLSPASWSEFTMFPALSPDGRSIVFFRQDYGPRGDYWVIPTDGGEPRQLTFDSAEGGRPTWSTDGYIYFPSEREGTRTIWRVAADGGAPQPVTSSAGEDDFPAVSRDATRFAYTNTRIETRFMVWDSDTGDGREVYRSRAKSSFPKVSHDKTRVAFFKKSDPEEQIFVMEVGDWQEIQLTRATRGEFRVMPRWSADDDTIYFYQVMPAANTWSLNAVPASGGPVVEVFAEFYWDTSADIEWHPGGDHVVYMRYDAFDPWNAERSRVVIREIPSGHETEPGWPISYSPTWSADGNFVLGTSPLEVLVCPVKESSCTTVFASPARSGDFGEFRTLGRYAQWSSDDSRVFFNRPTAYRERLLELWVVDRDGSEPEKLFEYGPVDPLDGRFQILSGDRILWNELAPSHNTELWVATLSRNDSSP